MKSFLYMGHQYRVAEQEPPADETEQAPKANNCTDPDPDDPAVDAARAVLSSGGLDGTVIKVCAEQDGHDVQVDVGKKWSGIEAILTFDYSADLALQELVLKMCSLDFVAHEAKLQKALLGALTILQKADFGPQQATDQVEDKKKSEYIKFLQHYIAEMVQGALDLDYEDRIKFIAQVQQLGEDGSYPADRANVLAEGAGQLDDDEWETHIGPVVNASGQQHATTVEMVNQAVADLIPASEDYTGSAQVQAYLDNGEILVQIDVPKPAQSFMFVFKHTAGSKALQLVNSGFGICGGTFSGDADVGLAGALVSTMVDLAVLHGTTAQPELSKPPGLVAKRWDKKELLGALARGLVIWYGVNDYVRLWWAGKSRGCWPSADWKEYQVEASPSTLKNHLATAEAKKREVFQVDPQGNVDQLDYKLNVVKENIGTVNADNQTCEVR